MDRVNSLTLMRSSPLSAETAPTQEVAEEMETKTAKEEAVKVVDVVAVEEVMEKDAVEEMEKDAVEEMEKDAVEVTVVPGEVVVERDATDPETMKIRSRNPKPKTVRRSRKPVRKKKRDQETTAESVVQNVKPQ